MRIEEFSIRRYGPLPDSGRIGLGKFCLFFGDNEEGKTLTIDALIKLLFGKNTKIFERINRVEEDPDGFVVIKDDKGQIMKLPEKGDLTSLAGISSSQARNIFIIRDSDLSLSRESEHYRDITDRLTGMRTEKIEAIKRCLLDFGKLTPGGDFRDIKDEKLLSRLQEARALIDEIEELEKEVKREKYDSLEEELSEVFQKIKKVAQELKQLEIARNREKYEKGKKALETLEASIKNLGELAVFSKEDERAWIRHEQDIKREKERKKRFQLELAKKEKKFDVLNENLKEKKREFEILEKKKRKIDEDLRPQLTNYEIKRGELEQKRDKSRFFSKAAIISAVLFLVSMIGLIIRPALAFFYPLLLLFLSLFIGFALLRYRLFREEAWMKGIFERIRLDLAKFKLQGETAEDILSDIQKFEDDYTAERKKVDDITGEINVLKSEIANLEEEYIPEVEKKIRYAEDGIKELKDKSSVASLKAHREKLKELQIIENLRDRQIEALKTLFGEDGEELSKNISRWRDEIDELKIYKDKAVNIEYSREEEGKLKEQEQNLLIMKEEIQNKIKDFQEKLGDIERRVNAIFTLESDFLHCKTTVDLEAIKERLKEFIDDSEITRENVLKAIGFFNDIEKEEEEKITSLFGKGSPVSKYFSRITDGIYTEVSFNSEERKIFVQNKSGEILDAEKLSGGAYDQLYLSIRLGLGESLLMGKKSFFIMDDPFVKADIKRLREQIGILKKICDSGWQIMYFTAKDEVKEVLKEDIENKKIDSYRIGRSGLEI